LRQSRTSARSRGAGADGWNDASTTPAAPGSASTSAASWKVMVSYPLSFDGASPATQSLPT
jgi:hypothetical protein